MRRVFKIIPYSAIVFLLWINIIHAADPSKPEPSKDIPAIYYISAVLDTSAKTLNGSETVYFENPTNKELDVIIFHLYPNAFADTSTLMARNNGAVKSANAVNPGYIKCDSVTIDKIQPDSVVVDETLLYIYLQFGLKPGRTSVISLNFEIQIPPLTERFGYSKNGDYLFAHWHPILVGYQKNEAIVFQYGSEGEFFSNFADYEIKLQIPDSFKIASTSNINKPDSSKNGEAFYTLKAKRVIDFAFACGLSWQSESYYYDNIAVDILYEKENEGRIDNIKNYINESLAHFGDMFFAYPYPNVSYVDINPGAGGMELSRMVAMSFAGRPVNDDLQLPSTLIHETAHQWFYAVIATNEFDEAWLDEGITTYLTDRALVKIIGDDSIFDFYGIKFSYAELAAFLSRFTDYRDALDTPSDKFYDDSYYNNVYGKASATIKALEGVLGPETFGKALKDYANRYKFYHPDSHDLEKAFESSSGDNLDWFFDSYIFGTSRVDYEVVSLKSVPSESSYTSTVEVVRNYDGVLPQTVVMKFKDGAAQSKSWDGRAKYHEIEFEYKYPAGWAAIDTGGYYLIDEDFANNYLKIEAESGTSFALSALAGMLIQIMLIAAGLI